MTRAREIIAVRATLAGLTDADLVGACRTRAVSAARHQAMFLARRLLPHLSYPNVGQIFGGRDHTTVLYAERRVASQLAAGDAQVAAELIATLTHLGLPADLAAAARITVQGASGDMRRETLERRRIALRRELRAVEAQLTGLPERVRP